MKHGNKDGKETISEKAPAKPSKKVDTKE